LKLLQQQKIILGTTSKRQEQETEATIRMGSPKLGNKKCTNRAKTEHKFGVNNMKTWLHPALYQLMVVMKWCGDEILLAHFEPHAISTHGV